MRSPLVTLLHQDDQGVSYSDLTCLDKAVLSAKHYHYEYLDHTADLQLHAWSSARDSSCSSSLACSFESLVVAMYAYMTDLAKIECLQKRYLRASGQNLTDLLFHFLDEALFCFYGDAFLVKHVQIHRLTVAGSPCEIEATVYGAFWDSAVHPCGTEIKAVTMSNMQILHDRPTCDCYVIVDI